LTSSPRDYVHALVQDNLGLAQGQIEAPDLPTDLVDMATSTLRGQNIEGSEGPYLDRRMNELLLEIKRSSLESDGFFVWKARWPNASPFAVCLTHDVDNISHSRSHIISTRRRFTSSDLIIGLLWPGRLYKNIGLLAQREERLGFRSSLFVLSSHYALSDLSSGLTRLKRDGWDIGLHADIGTHNSLERTKTEVERFRRELGFKPAGVREHYLQFDFESTWEIMDSLGLAYDSTIGSRDALRFPLGLSTPFHPPGRDWVPMKLLEIPLTLMDTTIWGYLKHSEELGKEDIRLMMNKVREVGGLFTLLWHQEALRMRGGRLYPEILKEIAESHCHVSSAVSFATWWNARAVPLVREDGDYRFKGVPPEGLCLHFESHKGLRPRVLGGSLEVRGSSQLLKVASQDFRLKVE